ncbi:MAG: CopD family protein [Myxococcota bacterium]
MNAGSVYFFFHLLAVVFWIGGAMFNVFVMMPATAALEPAAKGALMRGVLKRFMPAAWGAIIVVVVTGFLLAGERLGSHGALFDTENHPVLVAKVSVVTVMIIIGLIISFVLGPKAAKAGPSPEAAKIGAVIGKLAMVNVALGVVVIGLAASL